MAESRFARYRMLAGDQERRRRLFPTERFEELGYNVAVHGQKGFNGVALSVEAAVRRDFTAASPAIPDDVQARYLEGVVSVRFRACCVSMNIYLPNGNGAPGEIRL